jgi:CheY-like chemotaxis protein
MALRPCAGSGPFGGGATPLIVALTGWGSESEEELRRTRAAGFDHRLVKPVDIKTLSELITGKTNDLRRGPSP